MKYVFNNLQEAIEAFEQKGFEFEQTEFNPEMFVKIIDCDNLDDEGQPKVVTDQQHIIVCDMEDWNSSYLLDMLYQLVDEHSDIFQNMLFKTKIQYYTSHEIGDYLKVNLNEIAGDKNMFIPFVMTINPHIDENGFIGFLKENIISPIRTHELEHLLKTSFIKLQS